MSKSNGTLYLIPVPLGEEANLKTIPPQVPELIKSLKNFIVENEKSARRIIKKLCPEANIQSLVLTRFDEHSKGTEAVSMIAPLLAGNDVGLMSEAGSPCLADPGSEIVKQAHIHGIRVVPLAGPSSILLALMGSGLTGQSFAFHGYLPVDKEQRKQRIVELERLSQAQKQTQIFMETPYRASLLLQDILTKCLDNTLLCIAKNLSCETEHIETKSIAKWRATPMSLEKEPVIFCLYGAATK